MNQSTDPPKKNNLVRARVTIRGTRPLLQHAFGPDAIPLEKSEKSGVAGNNPEEWRKTKQVTQEGQLYLTPENIFACLRDGAKYTKKGRGSIQGLLAATLQVEDLVVLLNRHLPKDGDPSSDKTQPVFVDISSVRNPTTKGRNIRYRLAASPGWECSFTILWDKTIVSRGQMQSVINDAGILVGIGDGRSIGKGRFVTLSFEELNDAKKEAAEGHMDQSSAHRVAPRPKKVQAMPDAVEVDRMPH